LKKAGKRKSIAFYIMHFIICEIVFVSIFSVVLVYHGPFIKLRDFVVSTSMGTYDFKFISTWFLSGDKINSILAKTNSVVKDGVQNMSGVKVQKRNLPLPKASILSQSKIDTSSDVGITVEDVAGPNYKGKLITIEDPSRVKVGLAPGLGKSGTTLSKIIEHYGAIGGINAGGFTDVIGAVPNGVAIEDGNIKFSKSTGNSYSVIGFNKDDILIISNSMTLDAIKKSHLRCAVSFGPALILNGQPLVAKGGTTLQPRSAIGQKKDGSVLLLAIDGRQSSSKGVNLQVLQNILLHHGAYNAANLDGGGSTTIALNGRTINNPSDLTGERAIASALVIMSAQKQ